ncbi:MAG: hypothetical protein Q4E13_04845 [Clostridia bacterium]|nr:hypothetical protein [Clostridia bacterium]
MAMTLEELTRALLEERAYASMSEEEMQRLAQNRYASTYASQKLGAQQRYETGDSALQAEMEGLAEDYRGQVSAAQQQTALARSNADRTALSRGMQRSSYNNATMANIDLAGAQTVAGLHAQEAAQRQNLQAQRTLLASQLAKQLTQYDEGYASDVAAYVDELRMKNAEQAWKAQESRNEILMALYEYGVEEQLRQQAARSSGGGRRSSSASTANKASTKKASVAGAAAGVAASALSGAMAKAVQASTLAKKATTTKKKIGGASSLSALIN